MSQEPYAPGGPKNHRRDSILKARQTEEVITTRNDRRVSFHNVKVVQYYDKDIQNCPELLHNGTPVKEKINETLGSDGVFSPGRTTISENSNHSSKNNTVDMFGERAKKPVPIVPNAEPEKFEIKETAPAALEVTNFNTVDMSVFSERTERSPTENSTIVRAPSPLEYTDYETMDMSVSNETTKMDDTLQMFSKSVVQPTESDTTLSETMRMFSNVSGTDTSKTLEASGLNATADMFANVDTTHQRVSPGADETIDMFNCEPTANAANISHLENTMEMFKSPQRLPIAKRTSMSTTLAMFNTPEKSTTPLRKRISMSTTLAMFQSPARTETQANISQTEGDNTLCLFDEPKGTPTILEDDEDDMEISDTKTDVSVKHNRSSTMPVTTTTTKSAETIVLSSDKTGDYSILAERVRGASPSHMSILQNETVLLTERSVNPASCVTVNEITMDDADISRPHRTISKTLDTLMNETKNLSMRSVVEENRGMCVNIDYSAMIEHVEPRLEKSSILERGDDVSKVVSMDISQMSVTSTSMRTDSISFMNKSSRSRRRSSMSNTIRDLIQQSPVPPVDLNASIDLSFSNSSNLFDNTLLKIPYLENGPECVKTLRQNMLHQFITDLKSCKERNTTDLAAIKPQLNEKFPSKSKAVETLNSRKLGPIDRNFMQAARYLAEKELLERRVIIAKEYGAQAEERHSNLTANMDDCEIKADLCDQVDILKSDVVKLNEKWTAVAENDIGAMKTVVCRHNEMIKELEKEENENGELQIQALLKEKEFIAKKYREQKEIERILENAKKEKEVNMQLLLERVRNVTYGSQSDISASFISADERDEDQETLSTTMESEA